LFAFNSTGERIIYSEKSDPSSNSQNLWFMDIEGKNQIQLASNLNIAGDRIIFHPHKSTVYFTVFTLNEDNSDARKISYSVYTIDYSTS
jgi:Tol biopolymer transport system component